MPTTLEASHKLRGQFFAESVDVANGIIRGATGREIRERKTHANRAQLDTLLARAQANYQEEQRRKQEQLERLGIQ